MPQACLPSTLRVPLFPDAHPVSFCRSSLRSVDPRDARACRAGGGMEGVSVRASNLRRSIRRQAVLLGSCMVIACFGAAPSFATCGSANCFLVTGTEAGVGNEGRLVVDLSYRYIIQ